MMSPSVSASPKWSVRLRLSNPEVVYVNCVPQVCRRCIKFGYITQTAVAGLVQPCADGKDVTILREIEGSYMRLNIHGWIVTQSHAIFVCPHNIAALWTVPRTFSLFLSCLCDASTIRHGDSVVTLWLQCDLSHLLQNVSQCTARNRLVSCLATTLTPSSDCRFWMDGSWVI
jgi:hypothetical protein